MIIAVTAGALMLVNVFSENRRMSTVMVLGVIFTGALLVLLRLWLDPDRIRAVQSNAVLTLASQLLEHMKQGLNQDSAQQVCDTLLPATNAIAVAITSKEYILGYAGVDKELNPQGGEIRTVATHQAVRDGQMRVLHSSEEIGFPQGRSVINAAILAPLIVSGEAVGVLKFYYRSANKINETQESIARGFASLLSTQIAAVSLEEQKKLATSMELKMLQSQINPHFLFNTINTIASLVRTDPDKARVLLREFAAFYRSTLEDSDDLIQLAREMEQTERYVGFERARFGDDRLVLEIDVPDELQSVYVPSFMLQPIVENAVRHGMPAEGQLKIVLSAEAHDDGLLLTVEDDGVGMPSVQSKNLLRRKKEHKGLGIAVRNIQERILAYYGNDSFMTIDSEEGEGTTVIMFLKGAQNIRPSDPGTLSS